jgi:hypothetical protein
MRMEAEQWHVEVGAEIAQRLAENHTNLIAEITDLADRRGLRVEIAPGASQSGSKDVAMILFGSAAVIEALRPLILAAIKVYFPQATAVREEKGKTKKLKIKAK